MITWKHLLTLFCFSSISLTPLLAAPTYEEEGTIYLESYDLTLGKALQHQKDINGISENLKFIEFMANAILMAAKIDKSAPFGVVIYSNPSQRRLIPVLIMKSLEPESGLRMMGLFGYKYLQEGSYVLIAADEEVLNAIPKRAELVRRIAQGRDQQIVGEYTNKTSKLDDMVTNRSLKKALKNTKKPIRVQGQVPEQASQPIELTIKFSESDTAPAHEGLKELVQKFPNINYEKMTNIEGKMRLPAASVESLLRELNVIK